MVLTRELARKDCNAVVSKLVSPLTEWIQEQIAIIGFVGSSRLAKGRSGELVVEVVTGGMVVVVVVEEVEEDEERIIGVEGLDGETGAKV